MGALAVKNLSYLRSKDPRLAEALQSIADGINTAALQTGASPTGTAGPPPTIAQLNVTAANGIFSVSIVDNSSITKGINYFIEWSLNPSFVPYRLVDIGTSRTHDFSLGNVTAYFRAYSQYLGSDPSPSVNCRNNPIVGGGSAPPTATPATGNGTAAGNGTQNGAGFGLIPQVPQQT